MEGWGGQYSLGGILAGQNLVLVGWATMELVDVVHAKLVLDCHVVVWDGISLPIVDDKLELLSDFDVYCSFKMVKEESWFGAGNLLAPSTFWQRLWEVAKDLDFADMTGV